MAYAVAQNLNKLKVRQMLLLALASLAVVVYVLIGAKILFSRIGEMNSAREARALTESRPLSAVTEVDVGKETSRLMEELSLKSLSPAAVSSIKRDFFSVTGRVIILGGDNLQAFEYASDNAAAKEASLFKESAGTKEGAWKKQAHLYLKGSLIILYMGQKIDILKALDTSLGEAVTLPK